MSRGKVKLARIANTRARRASYKKRMASLVKKTKELTILCNMAACLVFFSRDANKLMVWPSQQVAKSLFHRFFSLPDLERNSKALDQELYIKENMKKIERKLAYTRKVNTDLEIDNLMFQLHNGRRLVDLSPTEVDKLISYSNKKVMWLNRELGVTGHYDTSVMNEPSLGHETLKTYSNGNGFSQMGSASVYLMDKWFSDGDKFQKHSDESLLPAMITGLDLNIEPSDDDHDHDDDENDDDGCEGYTKICKGECSKASGAEDD